MSKFKDKVIRVVKQIPYGKVMSYGQVALYIGMPRAGRQVGWILNGLEEKTPLPWWRVVNNKGRISIKGSSYTAEDQRQMLIGEGVKVNKDLTFDIEKYRFKPDDSSVNSVKLDPLSLDILSRKLPYR